VRTIAKTQMNWDKKHLREKMQKKGTRPGKPNPVNDYNEAVEGIVSISHVVGIEEDKPDTYYKEKVALGLITPKKRKKGEFKPIKQHRRKKGR
jgi:hypothetical protein